MAGRQSISPDPHPSELLVVDLEPPPARWIQDPLFLQHQEYPTSMYTGSSMVDAPAAAAVMTEEQLDTLRRQISMYATICQQLVELHKGSIVAPSQLRAPSPPAPPFDGLGFAALDPPCSILPLIHHHHHHHQHQQQQQQLQQHKSSSRQRWTPSQNQLRILERLFKQGSGTPNRQRIKEITSELSQHGQISETNVYNWFQNRKARAKRKQRHSQQQQQQQQQQQKQQQKQQQHQLLKDGESEAETDGTGTTQDQQREDVFSSNKSSYNSSISPEVARYSVVVLNGKAWKVKPGRLSVWGNFGDKATLLDQQGQVVALDDCGFTLQALQPGITYTVTGC